MPSPVGPRPDAVQVWRPSVLGRVGAAFILVATAAGCVAIATFAVLTEPWRLIGTPAIAPVGFIAWRAGFRARIVAGPAGIVVANVWRSHRVPWDQFASAQPTYQGILIERRDGSRIMASAVQKSNLATWFHWHVRADVVSDALNARGKADVV